MQPVTPNPDALKDPKTVKEWFADHGGNVFRTPQSLEWFIRKHKRELAEAGVLIISGGSKPNLIRPGMAEKVMEILQRESRERVEAQEGTAA